MIRVAVLIVSLCLFSELLSAQSLEDTQDFLKEQIEGNPTLPNYKNTVLFSDLRKIDAEHIAGRSLTQAEYENLFICGRDLYVDESLSKVFLSVIEIADIRGIKKISSTRSMQGGDVFYTVNVYFTDGYLSVKYEDGYGNPKRTSTSKMTILLGNNEQAAEKIKRALIHLGKLKGVQIKDGDLF